MSSSGSLVFYGKKGSSDSFTLAYGKTTIGTLNDHHIRIKSDTEVSCVLDTNEWGVTTFVNENGDQNIRINNLPAKKYTIMEDGDSLELGIIKIKYTHPSIQKIYVEKTRETLNKKCGISENIIPKSKTPIKRLQNTNLHKRRFSTGCSLTEAYKSPKNIKSNTFLSNQTSTPLSAAKVRFSQRMITRRNSTLAAVKENEVFDFQSPIPKKADAKSPSAKRNKTFSGTTIFSSPMPSKNKTYSGNTPDVSENVTTPENNITAASITPLNVSKKTKKSLNVSSRLSYVPFPDSSSTPKSTIKMNRSSSLYRPLVEDITPASPMPRSSLRTSSLKKPAFTQRRSVNFNISSASDDTTDQALDSSLKEVAPSSAGKRKRTDSDTKVENAKSLANESDREDDGQNSFHDSSLSGIHNLSDTSFSSNKNVSKNISSKLDTSTTEHQSMVSWREEIPNNEPDLISESSVASESRRSSNQMRKKSNVRSKSLNLDKSTSSLDNSVFDESLESLEIGQISSTPLVRTRSKSLGAKIKSPYLNTRSKSLIMKRRLSVSLKGPSKGTAIAANFSKSSLRNRSRRSISSIDSIGNSSLDSTNKLFGSLLGVSLSENNDSTNKLFDSNYELAVTPGELRKSSRTPRKSTSKNTSVQSILSDISKSNSSKTSVLKTLKRLSTVESKSSSFTSRLSLRSKSSLNSDDTELLTVSKNVSFCETSSVEDEILEANKTPALEVLFKTPNAKTPRKLNTPKSSLKYVQDPTDVSPMEKLLKKKLERGNSPSDSVDESVVDYNESEVSVQDENLEEAGSVEETTPTPERIPRLSNKRKTPKSDLANVTGVEEMIPLSKNDLTPVGKFIKSAETPGRRSSVKANLSNSIHLETTTPGKDLSVNNSLKMPKSALKTPRVSTSPYKNLSHAGHVKLSRTPKVSPEKNSSMNKSLKTPRSALKTLRVSTSPYKNLSNVGEVKRLSRTPRMSPGKNSSMNKSLKTPKSALKTPRVSTSPYKNLSNVGEVKRLSRTPRMSPGKNSSLNKSSKTPKSVFKTVRVSTSTHESLDNDDQVDLSDTLELSPGKDLSMNLSNGGQVKRLSKTPRMSPEKNSSMKKSLKTPKSALKTSRVSTSTYDNVSNLGQVKLSETLELSPGKNLSMNLSSAGQVKRLSKTPRISPEKNSSINKTLKTPKSALKTCRVSTSTYENVSNVGQVELSETFELSPGKDSSINKSLKTPKSALNSPNVSTSIYENLSQTGQVKRLSSTPKLSSGKDSSMNKSLKTPKSALRSPRVSTSTYRNVSKVGQTKRLSRTPKIQKSPKNDLSNISGVKKLLKTPKVQKSPKNDLSNIAGVKKLLKTPKAQKSPKNDLTNIGGVKKILKTPKAQKSPKNDLTNVGGVKKLLKTPKAQKSPKNDLTNVGGVKKLLKTPKAQKSPKNDLTNVRGVKKLLKTPKMQKSPKNDLTSVKGVKKLLRTPKFQNSPNNDLTNIVGVKKLMSTPKEQNSPRNDLTQVAGVKKLMASPRQQKTPKNDLTDVRGVRQIMRTPKNKSINESHDLSGIDILYVDNSFDKLLGKKPIRTYGKSPKANKSATQQEINKKTPEHVMKWLNDQSQIGRVTIEETAPKTGKRKIVQVSEDLELTTPSPNKRQKTNEHPTKYLENENQTIELNISSNITEKPASTPLTKAAEPDVSNKRPTRKRNVKKSEADVEPKIEVKVTRAKKNTQKADTTEDGSTLKTDVEEKVEKVTRGKRTIKKVDSIEDEPTPKRTRKQQAKKEVEVHDQKVDDKEAEQSIDNVTVKKSTRTRQTKKKDVSVEEETKRAVENDETKLKDAVKTRGKRTRANENKPEDVPPNKNQNIEENKPAPKTSRNTKTRGKIVNKEIEEISAIAEKESDSIEKISPIDEINNKTTKKTTRTRGKTAKTEVEEHGVQEESDSTEKISPKNEVEHKNAKKTTRARGRTTKKEIDELSVKEESIEKISPKDEVENRTVKKTTRTRGKSTKKEVEEHSAIAEEVSESIVKGSFKDEIDNKTTKKTTRTRGRNTKKEVEEQNADKESESIGKIDDKDSKTAKKPTRSRRGKQNVDDKEEDETKSESIKKGRSKKTADNKKDVSIEMTTNEEDIDAEEIQQTKSARSNRGKNKKFNEDEWDTPVKKNSKKVAFKNDSELLQTQVPAEATVGTRSLRRRNVK